MAAYVIVYPVFRIRSRCENKLMKKKALYKHAMSDDEMTNRYLIFKQLLLENFDVIWREHLSVKKEVTN